MAIAFSSFGNFLDGARSSWRPQEKRLTTIRGILHRLGKYQLRLLCVEHGMQHCDDIIDVADYPRSLAVDVKLSCECVRPLLISVRSQFCDRCEARWIREQWAHESSCSSQSMKSVN